MKTVDEIKREFVDHIATLDFNRVDFDPFRKD
nr:MAG TPA: hypothetical protein [Caudoviricetes sp.]